MKPSLYLLLAGIAALAAGCAPTAGYWNAHPNTFVPYGVGRSKELVFCRPATTDAKYEFQVILGNDGARALKFAKYEKGHWVGDGLVLDITPRHLAEVGSYTIDYSPLSQATISPRQSLARSRCPTITVDVPAANFLIGQSKPIRTELEVSFALQSQDGTRLPLAKTALLKPMFLLLGFEEPFDDKQPATQAIPAK